MKHAILKRLNAVLLARFGRTHKAPPSPPWDRDPMAHPDIARMSERERADLPFERFSCC